MLVPVAAWFENHAKECDPVKTKSDLTDALVEHRDGYAMAKFLEHSAGWDDVDAQLVAALDGGCATLRAVLRNAVCAWVKQTGLHPAHKIGDSVV